jgi:hypothetical protein
MGRVMTFQELQPFVKQVFQSFALQFEAGATA